MTRLALAALLVASCTVAAPPAPTPLLGTPSDVVTPPAEAGLGRRVDPRDFSLKFTAWSPSGEQVARQLATALPDAWSKATSGMSRVRLTEGDADIHVIVLLTPGVSTGGGRGITLRLAGTSVGTRQIALLLHELGHAHGCCHGETADGTGHWAPPCDDLRDLMCSGTPGRSLTFSERELRALRLMD